MKMKKRYLIARLFASLFLLGGCGCGCGCGCDDGDDGPPGEDGAAGTMTWSNRLIRPS